MLIFLPKNKKKEYPILFLEEKHLILNSVSVIVVIVISPFQYTKWQILENFKFPK